jgi:hypothetical protein
MGRDIKYLTKHNLPIYNIDELILELSQRFKANVFYIFPSYINLDDHLERVDGYDLKHGIEVNGYIVKKHIVSAEHPNLSLEDDTYMYTFLLNKYGEEAGNYPEFKGIWSQDVKENNSILKDFSSSNEPLSIYFEDFSLWISKEAAEITLDDFFGRWWNLFGTLLEHDEHNLMDRFIDYRKRNREIALKIGGLNAYYLDSQSSNTEGIGQGNEWEMTWNEIETVLNTGKVGQYQIDLVKLLSDKEYGEKMKALANAPLMHLEYSVFYDDFGEIPVEN